MDKVLLEKLVRLNSILFAEWLCINCKKYNKTYTCLTYISNETYSEEVYTVGQLYEKYITKTN